MKSSNEWLTFEVKPVYMHTLLQILDLYFYNCMGEIFRTTPIGVPYTRHGCQITQLAIDTVKFKSNDLELEVEYNIPHWSGTGKMTLDMKNKLKLIHGKNIVVFKD